MAVLSRHRLPIGLVGLCVVLSVKCLYDVISCSLCLCACLFYVLTLGVLVFLLWLLQLGVVGDQLLSSKHRNTYLVLSNFLQEGKELEHYRIMY